MSETAKPRGPSCPAFFLSSRAPKRAWGRPCQEGVAPAQLERLSAGVNAIKYQRGVYRHGIRR